MHNPEKPQLLDRIETVLRIANDESRKTPQDFQASDLRRFFSTEINDLSTLFPKNSWLAGESERLATTTGAMKPSEFDGIVLGLQSLLSTNRSSLEKVVRPEPEEIEETENSPAEASNRMLA